MKKVLLLLLVAFIFSSCEKKYSYVETIKEYNPGLEIIYHKEDFKAKNDASAFLFAYTNFCKSIKSSLIVENEHSFLNSRVPISFSLSDYDFRKIDLGNELESEILEIKNKILGAEFNLNDVDKLLRRSALIEDVQFKMVFRNENVILIVTDTIVSERLLIMSLDSLPLSNRNVHYHLPGKIDRGEEWATLNGNVLIIFHENKVVEKIKR